MRLQVETIVSVPFNENTYVVWREGREDALVIDPGLEPELILECLARHGLTPAAILNTHGHADHIGGNEAIKRAFPAAPIVIGEGDAIMLLDAWANLSALFGQPITSPAADRVVREGEVVDYAGIALEVLDIPGHSPGHVAFVHRATPCHVFGGDVLFRGSIGRYDFPGGDGPLLLAGIREKLFPLPDDTIVYPGHGPVTTIGQEKRSNPYFGNAYPL